MATIIENDLGLTTEDFTPEEMAFFQDYMSKQRDIMSSSPTTVSPEEDMLTERYFQVMDAALARKKAKAAAGSANVQQAAKALAAQKAVGGPIDVDNISIVEKYSPEYYEVGEAMRPKISGDLVHGDITPEAIAAATAVFEPPQSITGEVDKFYDESTMRGIIATDRERIQQGYDQINELRRRGMQARRGSPAAGAPGFTYPTPKDLSDLKGFRGDISRMKGMLENEMSGTSYADLSGQTLPPEFPDLPSGDAPQRGTMATPEEQRNDLMLQYNMHEEAMRNIPRTVLGQIAPRDQAEFSHHKRESDRALALLEGIDKGAAEKDAAFNMMEDAGIPQEYPPINSTTKDFNVVGDVELSDTGMIPKKDYYPFGMMDDNFGKLYQPDVSTKSRGVEVKALSPTGRKRAAEKAGKEMAGESAPREQAPTQSKAQEIAEQSAQNMIERLIDKQSQGAGLATLMPSIRMFNEQLRRAAERDPSMDDLEKRLKSTRTGRELFALDAEVRNLGRDRAAREAAAGMTGAIEAGAGSAQAHFRIENAKEKARGTTAKEVFGSMGAVELLGYEKSHEDYLNKEPSVRIAYNNAIQDKLKEIDEKEKVLAGMRFSDRMDMLNEQKAMLAIEKAMLENKKLGLEIQKKKTPSLKQYKASLTSAASMANKFLTDPYIRARLVTDAKITKEAVNAARAILREKSDVDAGKTYTKSELSKLQKSQRDHFETLMRVFSGKTIDF
ncbi:MAG: hypothetical protein Unbinned1446contig1004_14 [Prokaryotic dsDNA virus sp.]|nr:MAG: hypothetical protein Unbinned1446contig1004_14 [Prokaryotic dsDNA virus sp.]|tara:strand:+ start:20002 stop:22185 length:2184 start_codon:yes stop_codon:yes gene_type:complete